MPAPDPVALSAELIRQQTVTPDDGRGLDPVAQVLGGADFACRRVDRGGVANLVARFGRKRADRTFGFNGHTDVVPPGPLAAWSRDPFGGAVEDGRLWGRGACDMKTGVAAFVAAAAEVAPEIGPDRAILVTVTGDEEGPGRDGTRAILDAMAVAGEVMDVCLVGEPTSARTLGDTVKIGRRGSLNATFTATGRQGHSAYPERAANPLPPLLRLLTTLDAERLDDGGAHFQPSTLAVTSVDTGNAASNVIPGQAVARANIRFNDAHDGAALARWLAERAAAASGDGVEIAVQTQVSGEAFLTPPGPLSELVSAAIRDETGLTPALTTGGGTSDARFIRAHCPVVEFGLPGTSMHQVDEWASVDDVRALTRIYARILRGYLT